MQLYIALWFACTLVCSSPVVTDLMTAEALSAFVQQAGFDTLRGQNEGIPLEVADVVMYDIEERSQVPFIQFANQKWFPMEVNAQQRTVLLASTSVQFGTRPSAQQRLNMQSKAADALELEQLRNVIQHNRDAADEAEKTGNATAIGTLFLERKTLETALEHRLARQRVHADHLEIRKVFVADLGLNTFHNSGRGPHPRFIFIGLAPSASRFLSRATLTLEDPGTPLSEFGEIQEPQETASERRERLQKAQRRARHEQPYDNSVPREKETSDYPETEP
jgi:hypothetical protein